MAFQLTTTLTLASTTVSSDALSFSVTDTPNVEAPTENVARITTTTTGNESIIVPNANATRYVYIKHLGLNSAGGDSGADQVKVETADGTEIMRISKNEFAFFPHYAGGAGLIQLEATANTVQVEYAYFTRA
jgi:hypothetical protein|tara:strand:- start:403 stop:798 length:396 start_codon:yes stop_codon:yes gene_type:complete